jgi:hypothetical protein
MSQNGVNIQIDFAKELQLASALIQGTPKQLALAGQRAIKKTMRWVKSRMARELAQSLAVSQKALAPRFYLSTDGVGLDATTILWMGVNALPAEMLGHARQTKSGVTVGKRKYAGAFYRKVYGDKSRVWRRVGASRFPVKAEVVEISEQATEVFNRFQLRVPAEFQRLLKQELNYVVNHAK